jgi:hypothetical protein
MIAADVRGVLQTETCTKWEGMGPSVTNGGRGKDGGIDGVVIGNDGAAEELVGDNGALL